MSVHTLSSRILWKSAGVAFFAEFLVLFFLGNAQKLDWSSRQSPPRESHPIEAEVLQISAARPLIEQKKTAAAPKKEKAIRRAAQASTQTPPLPSRPEETTPEPENQTVAAGEGLHSHGPVIIYSPMPVIPSHLQEQDLKASVVIDFFVNVHGEVTPRLVGSSGSEELDAIALETIRKWQFRPAEKDSQPIDSKVRLRILFEVS